MKKLPPHILHGGAVLLLATILSTGWWLAGAGDSLLDGAPLKVSSKGPMEAAFCGPLRAPMPPPPMDSPYGLHLYATTPKGTVHPLPAMEIVSHLALPPGTSEKIDGSTTPKNETTFDDIQTVTTLLEEFRRAFGAMPTGELNDEIVRRLQGENPKGIAVLPKTHPNLSAEGELLDRFGTPYRFHPESAWHMTVRSAGPDKKMWTSDDQISEDGLMAGGSESGTLKL